jgi:Fic family protein
MIYIHQKREWPNFTWDSDVLLELLAKVRNEQGKIVGSMAALGFDLRNEASLETLTLDIIKSNEIEDEILDTDQVRSSVARRLGIEIAGLVPSDRDVEGVVDMIMDATQNYKEDLTSERLFSWHAALFPTGRSGMYKIKTGDWRDDATGPMQVVSGGMGQERVHFQALHADLLPTEIEKFLSWLNKNSAQDAVLKAAIGHLWFITLHPFDDGNGRIARAITDMLLARADGLEQRFYSMSAQIQKERKQYYAILEEIQKGGLDVTDWLIWFLDCLLNALNTSNETLQKVIMKHRFWTKNAGKPLNKRQILLLNKLLDGFKGKLTSTKWGKIAKCSSDTALRDIQDLIQKDILQKAESGGKNTSYHLVELSI